MRNRFWKLWGLRHVWGSYADNKKLCQENEKYFVAFTSYRSDCRIEIFYLLTINLFNAVFSIGLGEGQLEHRFSRTEKLIGSEGLEVMASSTVAVFGLGGVGSYAAEALARAGTGGFILVDFDAVSISNINRQLHAMEDTLGMAKVDLMADRIKKINPRAHVTAYRERYTRREGGRFFNLRPHYVVDAIDDLEGKVGLIKYCLKEGISLVSSMGAGNKLDPAMFRVDDISRTSICPLARAVRRRLRQEGILGGVKVVFSTERPCRMEGEAGKTVPGSISFVPPVAGMILAGVAVRDILSRGRGC